MSKKWFTAVVGTLLLVGACTKQEVIQPPQAEYIGSEACGSCHEDEYTTFMNSGHPYILNSVEDILAAGGPAQYFPPYAAAKWQQSEAGPPPGTNWEDFIYVIGGFGWKARFIRPDGYIYTGSQVQYNLETNEWVAYHEGEEKPYTCGECHTTGYTPVGNQNNLEGLEGTWVFEGVQCEECHGPGSLHAEDPYANEMEVPVSEWEKCGRCHRRGNPYVIDAKGGYIKHHEQYEEILASKKAVMSCTDCHNPHASPKSQPDMAIKVQCETCHFAQAQAYREADLGEMYTRGVTCIDCHMPYAVKSAVAREPYQGDVRSHLFAINTDPDAPMFSEDGTQAMGYLTLQFACGYCHDGTPADSLSLDSLAITAPLVHPVEHAAK